MSTKKLILLSAIVCCAFSARADVLVDSLERMILKPTKITAQGGTTMSLELWYYQKIANQINYLPFRIYQEKNAVWFKWGNNGLITKSFAINTNGNVRMGNFTSSTTNIPQSVLTLYNSTGIGLYIEQGNSNAGISVNSTNPDAYFIRGTNIPQSGYVLNPISFYVKTDGTIYSANSQLTLSDKSHKSEIKTVSNALDGLRRVNPVSYVLDLNVKEQQTEKQQPATVQNADSANETMEAETMEADSFVPKDEIVNETIDPAVRSAIETERNRPKYGFVAQEIAEIFPNVVYTLPTGEKAIAYQEIIPILVCAIQELQAQVDSLKTEQTPATPRQQMPAALSEAIAEGTAALFQNAPNPFDRATEIGYRLPQGTATAMILVCDMSGKLLESFPLPVNAAAGELTLQAGSFAPGMYLYSLLIDGSLVDTKQMVILAH